jgi:hypothetical protein
VSGRVVFFGGRARSGAGATTAEAGQRAEALQRLRRFRRGCTRRMRISLLRSERERGLRGIRWERDEDRVSLGPEVSRVGYEVGCRGASRVMRTGRLDEVHERLGVGGDTNVCDPGSRASADKRGTTLAGERRASGARCPG